MTPILLAFLGLIAAGASFYALHGALWGGHTAEHGVVFSAIGTASWGVFAYSSLDVRVGTTDTGDAVTTAFEPLALLAFFGFVVMAVTMAYAALEVLNP